MLIKLLFIFLIILSISGMIVSNSFAQQNEPKSANLQPREFWQEVVLVTVPVLIGTVGAGVITNFYQKRNEGNKLRWSVRQEKIQTFEKIVKKYHVVPVSFVHRINNHYIKMDPQIDSDKHGDEQNHIIYSPNFPEDINEYPLKRFEQEFKEFHDNAEDERARVESFLSGLSLYYEGDVINKKSKIIISGLVRSYGLIDRFICSQNPDDFMDRYNEFVDQHRKNEKLLEDFEYHLLYGKIKI